MGNGQLIVQVIGISIIGVMVVTLILSFLLLLTEFVMILSGSGWMQIFGYSWEFDRGEAIGGTYNEVPRISAIDPKHKTYYTGGLNLMYVGFYGLFGSLIVGIISGIIVAASSTDDHTRTPILDKPKI